MSSILKKAAGFIAAASLAVSTMLFSACADDQRQKLPENDALSFTDGMGAGWNLGNGFDAANCTWVSDELDYESAWCGAKASRELIKAVKAAGFGTIRVPVSWHDHVDKNYKISDKWMNRVKEVVDWCVEEDLYVIINIHHDNDKNERAYFHPDAESKDRSVKYIKSVWQQVAETFKDYGSKLIFQGMNEPRLTGTDYEWWYMSNSVPEAVKTAWENINLYNQTFVDTVRATGGNNADRYLLIVGYAGANNELGVLSPYYKLPTDTAKNKLIVDCHYYGIGERSSLWVIDNLYNTYTSKGIPVAVTEYGLNENGYDYNGHLDIAVKRMGDFYSYARNRGISVVMWDNNAKDKGFRFIDRATGKLVQPEIIAAAVKGGAPAIEVKTAPETAEVKNDNPAGSGDDKNSIAAGADSKPAVTAKAYKNKVKLSWNTIDGASKYAVYMKIDGKFKRMTTVKKTSAVIKELDSKTKYTFYVKAYVNGKWTKVTSKDKITVKTK